jgi:hypothetical protein
MMLEIDQAYKGSPENHTPNRFDTPESLPKIDCVEKISCNVRVRPAKPTARTIQSADAYAQGDRASWWGAEFCARCKRLDIWR